MDFISKENQFKHLHQIPVDLLKIILKEAYFYETHYDMSFDWRELYEQSQNIGCSLKMKDFQGSCKAVQELTSWLIQNNRENTGKFTFINILSTHSSISEDSLNELESLYDELLRTYPGKSILKAGLQLVDVDWRAGITMATDDCKSLNSPYVQLKLSFVNPQTGLSSSNTLSLDYQSFTVFLRDVRKINGLLATYN
jgi:hypothetical protein